MRKEDSGPAPSDLFESSEQIAPETILPLQEMTELAFVLRAPNEETVIDVWKTSDGAHFCCTSTVCYRLSAGVAPLLRLFPLLDSEWEVIDGDVQAAVRRLRMHAHSHSQP
jgi:hypothetical protein